MLKAIVFNALRVVQKSTNGLLFAIKCLKSLLLCRRGEGEQQSKKFLSIGTNSETKTRQQISLLNLHTAMTLWICELSPIPALQKKTRNFFSLPRQSKMIDLCVVNSWMGNHVDMTGQMITTAHSSFVWTVRKRNRGFSEKKLMTWFRRWKLLLMVFWGRPERSYTVGN